MVNGLLYKLWQLGEDSRAGTASYDITGRVAYTGQLALFMGMMQAMSKAEDVDTVDSLFPSDPLASWYQGAPGPLFMGI